MLSKILFTIAVIIGVIIFFRHRQSRAVPVQPPAAEPGRSLPPRIAAFGLLGVLGAVALLIFALEWRRGERIVSIRVISNGATADYRARYKSIKGRNFVTLDGARVSLGESDRIEMIEP
ncbi:MAG: hypothetical protein OXU96_05645 [Gammaproteobacteria bacterium]|nr:hypothetical protein [Gammaproteobacteria bacterium]